MKKLIVAALVLGVVAAVVNDGARYLATLYVLEEGTQAVADAAAVAAREDRRSSQPGGREAVRLAAERGFAVYGYDADETSVRVWTKDEVEGTWVAGPFLAWRAGRPLSSPPELTKYGEAYLR